MNTGPSSTTTTLLDNIQTYLSNGISSADYYARWVMPEPRIDSGQRNFHDDVAAVASTSFVRQSERERVNELSPSSSMNMLSLHEQEERSLLNDQTHQHIPGVNHFFASPSRFSDPYSDQSFIDEKDLQTQPLDKNRSSSYKKECIRVQRRKIWKNIFIIIWILMVGGLSYCLVKSILELSSVENHDRHTMLIISTSLLGLSIFLGLTTCICLLLVSDR